MNRIIGVRIEFAQKQKTNVLPYGCAGFLLTYDTETAEQAIGFALAETRLWLANKGIETDQLIAADLTP